MANETNPEKLHTEFQREALSPGKIQMIHPPQDLSKLREPIPIERVDFRIQSISKDGWAKLLAYKDARVDMDRLDAVVGLGCWQRKHEDICGNLFGAVGIFNERLQQWVWVQDVGVESKTEKEKGEASDSFKRACFNLGIGRELYNYPNMLVKLLPHEFELDEKTKKGKQTWGLKLREWTWTISWRHEDNGRYEVEHLYGHDEKGVNRYKYPHGSQPRTTSKPSSASQMAAELPFDDSNDSSEGDYGMPGPGDSRPGERSPADVAREMRANAARDPVKSDALPWFNDFDKRKDEMYDMLEDGRYENPQAIIDDLKKKYKVSKVVEDKIRKLGVADA